MRRFSAALRYAYNRLLEGQTREELKRQDGPLCTLFRLNTRHADDATLKAQALLDSARERGEDPRKVVFGGRGRFEQLKRRHLSGKPLKRLKREWRERRQGHALLPGGQDQGGQPQPEAPRSRDGALWLRDQPRGTGATPGLIVKTGHPNLNALLQRVYASLPYNVELSLKEGKVYAHITWTEEPAPLTITKENGVLALDVNSDPYHLALAVVATDGNLVAAPHPLPGGGGPGREPWEPRSSSSGRWPTGWSPWPWSTAWPSPRNASSTSARPRGAMAPAGPSGGRSTASPTLPSSGRSTPWRGREVSRWWR